MKQGPTSKKSRNNTSDVVCRLETLEVANRSLPNQEKSRSSKKFSRKTDERPKSAPCTMILQASPAPAIDTFDFQEIPGVGLLITQSEQQHNNETKSTLTLTTYEDVASISQKSLPGSSQTICGLHVNGNEGGNFAEPLCPRKLDITQSRSMTENC